MSLCRTTKSLFTLTAACALGLSACGGGSGSAGTTSAGGNTGVSGSSDCALSGSVFSVVGNTAQVDSVTYASDESTVLTSMQNKYTVQGGANFRGEGNLLEINSKITITYSSAAANGSLAGQTLGPFDVQAYVKTTATDLVGYGYVTTSTATGAVTTYFTPATSTPLAPALNTAYAQNYTIITEATATQPQSTVSEKEEVTYLGVESVSVPAGTYSACKVKTQTTTNGRTDTSYKWDVASGRLKGLTIKRADANGKKTEEATVLLVNGV